MQRVVAAIVAALVHFPIGTAVADFASAEISCGASHSFYCDADGCTRDDQPGGIYVRLYLDLQSGTGELCEYEQCRGLAAARFGGGATWEAQLALGPSNFILQRAERGEDVEVEAMLPTFGAQLSIDLETRRFMVSEQGGASWFGYFGTCEDAADG